MMQPQDMGQTPFIDIMKEAIQILKNTCVEELAEEQGYFCM